MHGLLLAAGGGRRMGMPKALVRDEDGTSWLLRSLAALRDGGCPSVTVVLGAEADRAAALLATSDVPQRLVHVVVAPDWEAGMAASLRAGLIALERSDAFGALVSLVDLPDVNAAVVARVLGVASGAHSLARATYDGVPGHPVLLGRAHWAPLIASASGDSGARDYLAGHDVRLVECGDLATGHDIDTR